MRTMRQFFRDRVKSGGYFPARSGGTISVQSTDGRGFTCKRPSGKSFRVSWGMVEKTVARLQAGERLCYQASPRNGGVSYTVAVVSAVEYALRHVMIRHPTADRFVLGPLAGSILAKVG